MGNHKSGTGNTEDEPGTSRVPKSKEVLKKQTNEICQRNKLNYSW